ncbi:MAG: DUF3489 domain-containing protein [Brevundimonas sp.]|nr:DUF3489 domain-containing protein [Brevundimonas sp.]
MREVKPSSKRLRKMARNPKRLKADTSSFVLSETPKPRTKTARVELMLQQHDGTTLDELCAETGWQPHICRAFLTGQRKKGRELIRSKREDDKTSYRLAAPLAYD